MLRQVALAASLALGAVAVSSGAARADAIDGNWCFDRGQSLSIDGPNIVTPGGSRITGDYSRHGFAYVVPASEPGAGAKIVMSLIDDDTMQLQREAAGGQPEIWRRCRLST